MTNYKDLDHWKIYVLDNGGRRIARIWPPIRAEHDPLEHVASLNNANYVAYFSNWTCAGIAYGRSQFLEVLKNDVLWAKLPNVESIGAIDGSTNKTLSVAVHKEDLVAAVAAKACQCGGLKFGGGTCSDWCHLSPNYVAKD
jgi:hypothetical protein